MESDARQPVRCGLEGSAPNTVDAGGLEEAQKAACRGGAAGGFKVLGALIAPQ